MKIVRPAQGTAGVYFPVGRHGTCEFATEKCLAECCVRKKDYDEELRISVEDKALIYDAFMNETVLELCIQILTEMDGLQTNILHWFASGDCKKRDVKRILTIVEALDKAEIVQAGFTRNEDLWKERKDVFVLTVEDKGEIGPRTGVFAVPNYKTGETLLYVEDGKWIGGCGVWEFHDATEEIGHLVNCKSCLRLKVGCFVPWKDNERLREGR